jgi:hypothetical protein
VYHYFEALLNCEACTEAIVETVRLDADARLGEEPEQARGGWEAFFTGCG